MFENRQDAKIAKLAPRHGHVVWITLARPMSLVSWRSATASSG